MDDSFHGDHRMPATDQSLARTMFKLKVGEPLPDAFLKLYWAHRHVACKIGRQSVPPDMLVFYAITSGADTAPPPPPTIYELWRDGKVKRNAVVSYLFRGERTVGKLLSLDAQQKRAQVRNDSTGKAVEADADTLSVFTPEQLSELEQPVGA